METTSASPGPIRCAARCATARARAAAVSAFVAAGVAGAAGCSADPALFLDAPAGALVVATRSEGQPYTLAAYASPREHVVHASAGEVVVLGYTQALGALGLPEGALTLDPAGAQLPEPAWIERARGGDDGWERLEALPPELASVRVRLANRCLELTERARFEEAVGLGGLAAIPVDGTGVLVTTNTERVLFVRESGAEDVTARFAGVPRNAGHWDSDRHELWMLGVDGHVSHGPLEGPFVDGPPLPDGPYEHVALAGSPAGEPLELYVVTSTLSVWRFDGARWVRFRKPTGPGPESTLIDVTWQGPGLAWATGYTDEEVLRIESGWVTPEWTGDKNTLLNSDGLRRILWTGDRWGLVAGMRSSVRHRLDGTWRDLPAPQSGSRNLVIAELAGSLFFGGEDGVLNQIAPGPRACDAVSWAESLDAPFIGLPVLGDGLLTVPRASLGPLVMKLLVPR